MAKSKKKSKKAKTQSRISRGTNALISGLVVNYNDTDPLVIDPCEDTITGLPYDHKNPLLKPSAANLFAKYKDYIFNNNLDWCITVTPISIVGEPMREPVEVAARCKIAELTDATESYIESVLEKIDMDFYSHWNFSCLVKK